MSIRVAVPEDRDEWCRMRSALWPHAAELEHREEIDGWFSGSPYGGPPLAAVFVCDRGAGQLAGFLELSIRPYAPGCDGPTPYVEGWWVDADVRRAGHGRALVAAAEVWARRHGYREIASDALLENDLSHAAHRALGFEEIERVVCYRKLL